MAGAGYDLGSAGGAAVSRSPVAKPMARIVLATVAVLLLCGPAASRGEMAARTVVTLATATAGGGFEAYGRALAEVIAAVDPTFEIQPRPSRGSLENLDLLAARKVDLALVTGEAAQEAFAADGDAAKGLRVLSVMYAAPGMFAVRADSPYRSVEDLKGKPVVFGARGSGLVLLARLVLDGLGLSLERDFQAILLDRVEDGPSMVLDGRAAAMWGAGIGWPPFVALTGAGARFISPDADGIERIVARHGFLKRLVVPAHAYPGQTMPVESVGSWSLILVRPGFDEALAYRLARSLHRSEGAFGTRLARARESTAANTVDVVDTKRIHPGVLRYLVEAGLVGPK